MMEGWTPVVRLRFGGGRYDERSLDRAALLEVLHFQDTVALTARRLWRRWNPNRERIPQRFEEQTGLRLRALDGGSTVAVLESPGAGPLFAGAGPAALTAPAEAVGVIHGAFAALARGDPLPDGCPRDLLGAYARIGKRLAADETLDIVPSGAAGARVSRRARERLLSLAGKPYEDRADVTGRISAVDVRSRQFEISIDGKRRIPVLFTAEQETNVIAALRGHASTRFRVRGRGEFSPDRDLSKIIRMENFDPETGGEFVLDPGSDNIMTAIDRISASIPDEVWEKIPSDLAERHDHYAYDMKDE